MSPTMLTSPDTYGANAWRYLANIAQLKLNGACYVHSSRMDEAAAIDALDYLSARLLSGANRCSAPRPPTTHRLHKLENDLKAVCKMLSRSELAARNVRLSLTCEPIVLRALRSWQTCLLVSELVQEAARDQKVTSIWAKMFTLDQRDPCGENNLRCVSPLSLQAPVAALTEQACRRSAGAKRSRHPGTTKALTFRCEWRLAPSQDELLHGGAPQRSRAWSFERHG